MRRVALVLLALLLAGCTIEEPPAPATGATPSAPGVTAVPTPEAAQAARLVLHGAFGARATASDPGLDTVLVVVATESGSVRLADVRLAFGRDGRLVPYGPEGSPLRATFLRGDDDGRLDPGDVVELAFAPPEPLRPRSGFHVRVETGPGAPLEVSLETPSSYGGETRVALVEPTGSTPPQGATPAPPQAPARFAGCSDTGRIRFANAPMRMQDVDEILPYGLVVGAHVTPIDHMYFSPLRGSPRDAFEVRAIADGVIYEMGPRDINVDTGQAKAREWRMDIAHTCTFASYFDLLTSITPEIEAAYDATRGPGAAGPWQGIPVKAGQLVGRIGAQTLDFGVYDYEVVLPGFVVPEHYDREPWKVHTVDPFPWFDEPIRSEMLARLVRTEEPRAGKIDWDVDGTLRGNWFAVGTRGYEGLDPAYYWEGHLSLAPDFLDHDVTVFSIGNWSGRARQVAIGGGFDATAVTPASGPQKLVLHPYGHTEGRTTVSSQVEGIALVEMTGPRTLRVEVFPGASPGDVSGFTPKARFYER